jgi:hypothetical protein
MYVERIGHSNPHCVHVKYSNVIVTRVTRGGPMAQHRGHVPNGASAGGVGVTGADIELRQDRSARVQCGGADELTTRSRRMTHGRVQGRRRVNPSGNRGLGMHTGVHHSPASSPTRILIGASSVSARSPSCVALACALAGFGHRGTARRSRLGRPLACCFSLPSSHLHLHPFLDQHAATRRSSTGSNLMRKKYAVI